MDKEITIILLLVLIIIILFLFSFLIFMLPMHMQMMGFSFPSLFVFIFLAIFLLFFLFLIYFLTKKTSEETKVKYVYPLTEEEKNIIEFLKNNNNQSTQKSIQLHFNLSKVKTHRLLTRLESKGIILRVKKGKEMLIVLKKENVE